MNNNKQKINSKTFSPSRAERYLTCAGSIALTLLIPEFNSTNQMQILGTEFHKIFEDIIKNKYFDYYPYIDSMSSNDKKCLRVIQSFFQSIDDYQNTNFEAEKNLSITFNEVTIQGIADCVFVKGKKLYIVDYKHGYIYVEHKNNPQLMIYALMAIQEHQDIEEIELVIIQPNAYGNNGPIRSCIITKDFLNKWFEEVLKIGIEKSIKIIDEPINLDNYTYSKNCKYCPAKIVCPLIKSKISSQLANNILSENFNDIKAEDISEIIELHECVNMTVALLEETILSEKNSTNSVPEGLVVYSGREGNRTWANNDVLKLIEEQKGIDLSEHTTESFITPTQALEQGIFTQDELDDLKSLGLIEQGFTTPKIVKKL